MYFVSGRERFSPSAPGLDNKDTNEPGPAFQQYICQSLALRNYTVVEKNLVWIRVLVATVPDKRPICTFVFPSDSDVHSSCTFSTFSPLIFTLTLKGTVARDFWPLVFFMNRPHMGP